jgi:hypothetical protein
MTGKTFRWSSFTEVKIGTSDVKVNENKESQLSSCCKSGVDEGTVLGRAVFCFGASQPWTH